MKNKTVFYQPNLTDTEFASGSLASFMVYREYANAKADYPNNEILAYTADDIEEPTFVDDEDFTQINEFYVDIPQLKGDGTPSDEMRNVATFKTKEEAIEYAKLNFGADENGLISIVNQS